MKITATVYETETMLEAAKTIGLELAKSKDIPVTEERLSVKQHWMMSFITKINVDVLTTTNLMILDLNFISILSL